MRLLAAFLLLAFGAFWLAGRDGRVPGPDAPAGPTYIERPEVLRIGFVPSEEDPERIFRRFDILAAYLERQLSVRVEFIQAGIYGPAVEALRAGKLDMAQLAPFAYVIAAQRANVEAIVVNGDEVTGPGAYHALLLTHPSSGLRTIDDVKARAAGITLSFANPASTSGHLVPRAFLESHGIDAEADFKRVLFSMNHTASVMTIKSRRVQLACVTENTYNRLVERGRISPDDVHVVWRSPPIFSGAICIRKDFSPEFRREVQLAYTEMRHRDPEVWAVVREGFINQNLVYLEGSDALFDGLREIASGLKNMRLLTTAQ